MLTVPATSPRRCGLQRRRTAVPAGSSSGGTPQQERIYPRNGGSNHGRCGIFLSGRSRAAQSGLCVRLYSTGLRALNHLEYPRSQNRVKQAHIHHTHTKPDALGQGGGTTYTMKPPSKPKVGSFQAMGLGEGLFRGVSGSWFRNAVTCAANQFVRCCCGRTHTKVALVQSDHTTRTAAIFLLLLLSAVVCKDGDPSRGRTIHDSVGGGTHKQTCCCTGTAVRLCLHHPVLQSYLYTSKYIKSVFPTAQTTSTSTLGFSPNTHLHGGTAVYGCTEYKYDRYYIHMESDVCVLLRMYYAANTTILHRCLLVRYCCCCRVQNIDLISYLVHNG